jgi:hypothetical protein
MSNFVEGGNVKKILFNNIPGSGRNPDIMPSGYEGLNWENLSYVEESYAHSHLSGQWKNVFKYSKYGVYNTQTTQVVYIRSSKKGQTFTIVSIDATIVDRSGSEWVITGFKNNLKIHSKQVKFQNPGQYQLLELNYKDIDEIQFRALSGIPALFIGCMNIII